MSRANIPITSIPGPTALTTAISMAGCSESDLFSMDFYLIRWEQGEKICFNTKIVRFQLFFMNLPTESKKLLTELNEIIGKNRKVYVFRELTKKFEETICGTPSEILKALNERTIKGEIVLILTPTE